MNKTQIKKLEKLGYLLIEGSNPPKFLAGGQFCGGYWEVEEAEALKDLGQSEAQNKLLKEFLKR